MTFSLPNGTLNVQTKSTLPQAQRLKDEALRFQQACDRVVVSDVEYKRRYRSSNHGVCVSVF